MANSFKALTLALFLCLGGTAHALYVDASPPPAWSPGGGPGGGVTGTKVGVNSSFSTGGYKGTAGLRVSGGDVKLPFAARYAPNVARVAGAVVFANPYLRSAAAIATWLGIAGLVYDATSGLWQKPDSEDPGYVSDGYRYCHNDTYGAFCGDTLEQVILDALRFFPSSPSYVGGSWLYHGTYVSHTVTDYGSYYVLFIINFRSNRNYENALMITRSGVSDCPVGWYVTPAGCIKEKPVKTIESEEEFLDRLAPHPMPEEVPKHIPEPLPVELPVIDPVFVPTGNPRPNPNYDPSAAPSEENQPWIQPGTKIEPAPTPSRPWQVDIQPVTRPVSSPEADPEVKVEPKPETGTGEIPPRRPGEQDAPPGLCDQYPDIIACGRLDEPKDPGPLKTIDIGGDFEILGGFAGSKVCPSFPTIDMLPGLSWQPFCDQLARIRPIVLAFAWLSAVMIILRFGRK